MDFTLTPEDVDILRSLGIKVDDTEPAPQEERHIEHLHELIQIALED